MKRITLYQQEVDSIEILDDCGMTNEEYHNHLSGLMSMNNIVILQTTNVSLVLRPSKITGIKVEEVNLDPVVEESPPSDIEELTVEEEIKKVNKDVITDVDT